MKTIPEKTKSKKEKEYPLPLDLYPAEKLSNEEFFSLLKRAVSGDEKSRNEIVLSYIPFVVKSIKGMVKKYKSNYSTLIWEEYNAGKKEDLFTSGTIGLIDAIGRFKINLCNDSASEARKLFFGYVKKYIRGYARMDIDRKYKHIVLRQRPVKNSKNEIARNIEISSRHVSMVSNDQIDELMLCDPMETENDRLDKEGEKTRLDNVLMKLDSQERLIIGMRFGVQNHTFKEIGKKLNRSAETIRQWEIKIIEKLRKFASGIDINDKKHNEISQVVNKKKKHKTVEQTISFSNSPVYISA